MNGVYSWSYEKGSFPVHLRSNGVFRCPKYPAAATYTISGNTISVDWKNFGSYTFSSTDSFATLEGSVAGNPTSWRKMEFVRGFTAEENILFGESGGGGTEWNWEWEKGSFQVEFRSDGFNHFVCPSFPAHSHYEIEGNTIRVDWGQYGKYELEIDSSARTLIGFKVGNPSSWRRATFVRELSSDALILPPHDHSHKHDEHCNH